MRTAPPGIVFHVEPSHLKMPKPPGTGLMPIAQALPSVQAAMSCAAPGRNIQPLLTNSKMTLLELTIHAELVEEALILTGRPEFPMCRPGLLATAHHSI